jgi:sec-independent protein translocase protein TatB
MFDIAPSEFLLVAFVALVVIGPRDLPKAMRVVGYWVGRARGVARQFRAGFDEMVREAEISEMEKKWAAENERIMREHPAPAADALPAPDTSEPAPVMTEQPHIAPETPAATVSVEHPHVEPAPAPADPSPDKAAS